MLTLLALVALTPVRYSFPADKPQHYDVGVTFDGFIPLFGGQQGKVELTMDVQAQGLAADSDGHPQVVSEIKDLKLLFNGAKLPLGLDRVSTYFPRTTASLAPEGQVLKSDAPDVKVPVRLPGLDVKRFPDITYLPIQFPAEGIEEGKSFTFRKSFGDSEAVYVVTPTKITDSTINLDLTLTQHYETQEDEALNIVTDPKDAVSQVSTDVTGAGAATFDRSRSLVSDLKIQAEADSKVTDLETKKETHRKLKTLLTIKAK
jgi:hypothetical protein